MSFPDAAPNSWAANRLIPGTEMPPNDLALRREAWAMGGLVLSQPMVIAEGLALPDDEAAQVRVITESYARRMLPALPQDARSSLELPPGVAEVVGQAQAQVDTLIAADCQRGGVPLGRTHVKSIFVGRYDSSQERAVARWHADQVTDEDPQWRYVVNLVDVEGPEFVTGMVGPSQFTRDGYLRFFSHHIVGDRNHPTVRIPRGQLVRFPSLGTVHAAIAGRGSKLLLSHTVLPNAR